MIDEVNIKDINLEMKIKIRQMVRKRNNESFSGLGGEGIGKEQIRYIYAK